MQFQIPLLQRYIFGELLRIFVMIVVCLTVLMVFVGLFQYGTDFGLGPDQLLAILPFVVPSLLPFTIPAALLLTVSLVYGRMAGDLETTAAKSAGINVLTLLAPSFLLGAGMCVVNLFLTDQVIPWAFTNIEKTAVSAMEDIIFERLRTEHQFGDNNLGIHVSVTDVQDRRLIRPVFRYLRGSKPSSILLAEEATIELDAENQQALIRLVNGSIELPGQQRLIIEGEETRAVRWQMESDGRKPMHLPIQDIRSELANTRERRQQDEDRVTIETAMALTSGDFNGLLEVRTARNLDLRRNWLRTWKLNTEMHGRFALACSCLFFVLVGSPLAVIKAQSRFLTSFLVCFVPIVAGYYPLVLGMMTQARHGTVDPSWAMWVGNAVLAVIAWPLLRRVARY